MSDIVIRVENLSKQYKIGSALCHDHLKDLLTHSLNGLFRRSRSPVSRPPSSDSPNSKSEFRNPKSDFIWALKDVSFDIRQGETLGIIGPNGAGKSTLLKILSRITEPTSGRAEIYGRVGSLLEVGIGFDRELTGRDNIYLNGAILGMTKREIDSKFDAIVDFSGVEKFIDTPVKHYSSGMYVRLAFAVAAHLEPEILIVDEVLAVGDSVFQQKCLGKMGEVAKEGRTVLFVSHNMGIIAELCQKTILLDRGEIVTSGRAEDVIRTYLPGISRKAARINIEKPRVNKGIIVRRVAIFDHQMNPSTEIDFRFPFFLSVEFEATRLIPQLSLWVRLVNEYGINVLYSWIVFQADYNTGAYVAKGQFPQELLIPGRFYIDVGAEHYRVEEYHSAFKCLTFDIINTNREFGGENPPEWGVIFPRIPWQVLDLSMKSAPKG